MRQDHRSETGPRLDFFLIWGHGLRHTDGILEMIRACASLEIVHIQRHRVVDLPSFVRGVYARDTAPASHLTAKTDYLLDTPREIVAVFVRNEAPLEQLVGPQDGAPSPCAVIKELKDRIRARFNPPRGEREVDEHVVHSSDGQAQTEHLLRVLGVPGGPEALQHVPNPILDAPYHLAAFSEFTIRLVETSALYCRILQRTAHGLDTREVPLEQSPHHRFLAGDEAAYERYLAEFQPDVIIDDHSAARFRQLAGSLRYLEPPHECAYIITERLGERRYVIRDGVHRASVLRARGLARMTVAVVR